MSSVEAFLNEFRRRTWDLTGITPPDGVQPLGYYLPQAGRNLEIAYALAERRPTVAEARALWRARQRGRSAGVLLVIGHHSGEGDRALVVGIHQENYADLGLSLVERKVAAALEAATEREALDLLEGVFEASDELVRGLRNKGLFASHELEVNTPHRSDWASAGAAARRARGTSGEGLLRALGWSIQHVGEDLLLRPEGRERDRAVAVLLEGDDVFDRPSLKYGLGTSPVEHGLEIARHRELPWVLAVRGAVVRLYASDPDVGVTRTGAASYVQLDVADLADDDLAFTWLLLTPAALGDGGSVAEILTASREHATSLGERLRERIYRDAIPELAQTIATKLGDTSEEGLEKAYHHTLVVLFRLLFVAYAEDRGLLPYGTNPVYTRVALKTRAKGWAVDVVGGNPPHFDVHATDIWSDLQSIWDAVYRGHSDRGVPEYGGSLFRADSESGAAIAGIRLTNREIGPALVELLVDKGRDGTLGPVDFQALSVREFGTIYEGLLESSLSLAPVDLTLDARDTFVPAKADDEVVVPAGRVYFHNASGARKATGSYFTKEFAVEHLLETALDPTVREHLERVGGLLDVGRDADAAETFFDFRVADIAMGSGHFLVAAVDHLAAAMSDFLTRRPIGTVTDELERLRVAALQRLASVGVAGAAAPEITYEALLRRQLARRCIYGVDINEIAVDLARLALWIHTFVPGLPMSSLDHGLIHGNSLTGIGTVDEALDELEPDRRGGAGVQSFFADDMAEAIAATDVPLARAVRLSEASVDETRQAEALRAEAAKKVADVRHAYDAIVGARLGLVDLRVLSAVGWMAVVAAGTRPDVREEIERLRPVHFPVAFPEAFRPGRARPGFDVILGNPPWDEVMVEEPKFWQRFAPGIMGLAPAALARSVRELRADRPGLVAELEREQERVTRIRALLVRGPFPGLGTGDVDYYKAFSWRYWQLLATHGRLGAVFPRSLLNAAGSALWREKILGTGRIESAVTLANTGGWVFEEVHGQYTVALLTIRSGEDDDEVGLAGPFHSLADFEAGRLALGRLRESVLLEWGNGAAFPLLPSTAASAVFEKFRRHPRFDTVDGWAFRPIAEFHATNDRKTFDAGPEKPGRWPVFTGATFDLWNPDFGEPYAWAKANAVVSALAARRVRQAKTRSSAFYGMPAAVVSDEATLECRHARIVFRDVTNQTNTRTTIVALAPPNVVLTNKAPYLYRAAGAVDDEAFVLGVLSSVPLDWYARRFVELSLSVSVIDAFPVPRPALEDPLRRRVVEIAGRLAAVDQRYAEWAAEVGVPVGSVTDAAVKGDLIAELDAVVGHLYGLNREDLTLIFETFHRGWDYGPRLTAVLAHYDRWAPLIGHEEVER